MALNKFGQHIQKFSETRFLILLILILLLLVLTPFLDVFIETRILMDVFLTVIFIFIIYTIRLKRSQAIVASALALPLIFVTWSEYFVEIRTVSLLTRIFGALFFAYATINILRIIAKSEEVDRETIFAAIVAYLLMALMWAFLYMTLERVSPGSFSFPDKGSWGEMMRYEYLSFVTITTLGYGDITPVTDQASSLVLIEAFIGQIYLVVLVAWLVGMHVSRRSK
ncbi:MAG: two pore domain potassium channel family protein [Deltaproteobacteria bacterium]|jgi:voltage-gated potassium channel|nr:two pore domain potassium channel family protein [Deltaproteobacteria bacterium]MBW2491916.1 two pore domain potassium channel family protein [Deltaproteobacteria bacterium]